YPYDSEIFLYDGTSTTQLTNNSYGDYFPQVSGSNVVWQGYDGNDYEIFLYDGTSTTQLTNNSYQDIDPQVSGSNVVWSGGYPYDSEIFLYDGTSTTQLTNNSYGDYFPQVSGSNVVWQGDYFPQVSGSNVVWQCREIFIAQRDPISSLNVLIQMVIDLNLQQGIENSLDAKLDAAAQALEDLNENNNLAAINTLQAFINAVQAQRGSKIPEAEADALIAAAREIIDLLSGG
ncbi:MAG: TolB family protein, partial [Planctomycetota bacterium]